MRVAALLVGAGMVLAGCGSSPIPAATPLLTAPEPAVSPPASADLPGTVLPLTGGPEGVAIDDQGRVAVNVRKPDGLVLFDLATPTDRRTVPLGGSARHLTLAGPSGPFLVPEESDDRLVEVDPSTGAVVASVPTGRQPHDAVGVGSGAVFVADELANTLHLVRAARVFRVVPAPLQPGGMAVDPEDRFVLVVGVRGRRITAYRRDGSVIGSANCGAGPTHAVTGSDGLYWVVDTDGGAVLGFREGAHGPYQVARITVGSQPYGVAYDPRRRTLWVTVTGADQLVGLHLRSTSVTSRTVYRTVRQPNTVAVDPTSGRLVVTGSTSRGSLQLLG